jgi:uncharacterized membrane protein YqaE (UPF0057 family)
MSGQKENNIDYGTKYDYSNTSAYRRKLKRDKIKAAKKAGQLAMQGPLSLLIVGIIDFLFGIITSMISLVMDFSSGGFRLIYDNVYSSGTDIIPNSEKFGVAFSMRFIRIIITVLIPPLGVFIHKGILGYFNIILCFILTYISFPLGIVYAFVVTYKNRYADRYEAAEGQRIFMIKEYVRSCTGEADKITDLNDGRISSLVYVGIFLFGLFGLLYWAFKNM